MRRAMELAACLALSYLVSGCGSGGATSGAAEPGASLESGRSSPSADGEVLPPLEGPVRVRLNDQTSLARTGGAANDLRLACRAEVCAMTWTDGPQIRFLRHRLGYAPSTPYTVIEDTDSILACLDLAPFGAGHWAAIVTTYETEGE
ncbi:MAG: hypothetical protein JRF63_09995, partial [Deltaproteobacteria bacterium]|nr:hypothetical protein [Deltaproteobacteria bacterium]